MYVRLLIILWFIEKPGQYTNSGKNCQSENVKTELVFVKSLELWRLEKMIETMHLCSAQLFACF